MDVVILAAGKGTRMKSKKLKVLHEVGGKPMVAHAVSLARKLKAERIIVVVPDLNDSIQTTLNDPKIIYAVQKKQLGTGDALKAALQSIKTPGREILVINGDMPLISAGSVKRMLTTHRKSKSTVTILTFHITKENGFGRVMRNALGHVERIIEVRDASKDQLRNTETNVGVYLFEGKYVTGAINKLRTSNAQKEYYLTDVVSLASKNKRVVSGVVLQDEAEAMGANSQVDLNVLNQVFYSQQRQRFMMDGVTMVGDEIFIDANVKINAGAQFFSPCYLQGQTRVGSDVVVETGCVIKDSHIADGVHLKAYCYIAESKLDEGCQIGPFAHLRPQTELSSGVKIGNFVETKKARIGLNSKVNHLSYIGDALIGKDVNVGAGTITCNYDGYNKFQTILEDGVFIGSDSQLVAPVTIGKGAFIGAGTTVTKNVSANSLAVSRVQQKEIHGWATRKRAKAAE